MPVALITGITGQTGSYLAEQLVRDGWEVEGLTTLAADSALAETPALPAGVRLHSVDLRDTTLLREAILDIRPQSIVNLAAISSVAASWRDPIAVSMVNALPVAVMLDAAREISSSSDPEITFVPASSSEMFGEHAPSPQSETTPVAPSNPYGASKAYGHALVGAYRAAGVRASSAILFNHESPRRPATFVTRKITSTVAAIAQGKADELVLGNMEVRRDWGWAPDYAQALTLMMSASTADDYVIATGISHSIEDFVAAAFATVGITEWQSLVRTDSEFYRPTDASEMRGDSTKIRASLGWTPTKSFNEIAASMVQADLATFA